MTISTAIVITVTICATIVALANIASKNNKR